MNKQVAYMLIFSVLAAPAAAMQQGKFGLYGEVNLLAGGASEKSSFNTEGQTVITDYNAPGQAEESTVFFPVWDLNFRIPSTNSELYFKSDLVGMASDFYMQAGYRHYLVDGSSVAIGFVPGVLEKETWQDPFALNTERQETKQTVRGLVFNYDNILGSSLALELAAGEHRVDDEQSGATTIENTSLLTREGNLYYAAIGQSIPPIAGLGLEWDIHYLFDDADGAAMRGERVGIKAELSRQVNRHIFVLGGDYSTHSFDASHPIFNEVREDTSTGFSLRYVYAAPYNWRNVMLFASGGWDRRESNIDFYDRDQVLTTLGLQYQF
ncbi:DUF2860 domain-containing protein [Photobacterium sp. TY1-4]|uniref:DUF2860 domain-containing protein n=1 Tax=Photobacterium sp. TY1-4 TaxID=2899122 RepID=UPI0021BEBD28|nr:DUF2860 domain-containing protein [Photobacterium sp. TY1-4]UXI02449.1 DUF2860 domain-containing protein [Photobacterium sp. TY1-4]